MGELSAAYLEEKKGATMTILHKMEEILKE